jgi:hypothetical protein
MPCNASYTRFIFWKVFIYTIIWYAFFYMHSYLNKILFLKKKWVLQLAPSFQAPTDIFRYTTEVLCEAAAQYATTDEATELRPALGSREATPISCRGVPSDIIIQNVEEGARGGKKRCKQHL